MKILERTISRQFFNWLCPKNKDIDLSFFSYFLNSGIFILLIYYSRLKSMLFWSFEVEERTSWSNYRLPYEFFPGFRVTFGCPNVWLRWFVVVVCLFVVFVSGQGAFDLWILFYSRTRWLKYCPYFQFEYTKLKGVNSCAS